MTRNVDDALKHAEQQRRYALRESPSLITDFILLADEVIRLRGELAEATETHCDHGTPNDEPCDECDREVEEAFDVTARLSGDRTG